MRLCGADCWERPVCLRRAHSLNRTPQHYACRYLCLTLCLMTAQALIYANYKISPHGYLSCAKRGRQGCALKSIGWLHEVLTTKQSTNLRGGGFQAPSGAQNDTKWVVFRKTKIWAMKHTSKYIIRERAFRWYLSRDSLSAVDVEKMSIASQQ